jgi:hypothetical protein
MGNSLCCGGKTFDAINIDDHLRELNEEEEILRSKIEKTNKEEAIENIRMK